MSSTRRSYSCLDPSAQITLLGLVRAAPLLYGKTGLGIEGREPAGHHRCQLWIGREIMHGWSQRHVHDVAPAIVGILVHHAPADAHVPADEQGLSAARVGERHGEDHAPDILSARVAGDRVEPELLDRSREDHVPTIARDGVTVPLHLEDEGFAYDLRHRPARGDVVAFPDADAPRVRAAVGHRENLDATRRYRGEQ